MSKVLSQPNGTTTTGRSSSVISIYDYPEHLNPFYEDEQHKRLRFWTLGKDKKKGRSNSFSLDSIKDWTFKSFRLKKRSSTLGINKTSESPPQLRRQTEDPYNTGSHYNTYDSRARNTVAIGLNSTYPNTFQRGATYRASLQDSNRTNPNNEFLIRNNRFRSTVQPSNTSTPIMKLRNGLGSQTSLNSTNPFDEDDTMSLSSVNTLNKPSRKKRRAPPPPVAIPTIQTTPASDEDTEKILAIHNLTSEIESFVRNTNEDDYYTKNRDDEVKAQNHQTSSSSQQIDERITINQSIKKDVNDKPAETTTHVTEEKQEIKITVIKPIEVATSIEINENVNLESNDKEKITPDKTIEIRQPQQDTESIDENLDDPNVHQKIEIQKKFVVLPPSTPERVHVRKSLVTEVKEINVKQEVKKVETATELDSSIEPEVTPRKKKPKQLNDLKIEREPNQISKPIQTPLSSKCEDILESTTPNMKKQKFDLRISESVNSLDEKNNSNNNNNHKIKTPSSPDIVRKTIKTENYEFKVRYKPLSDDNSTKESRYDQWTRELRRSNSDDSINIPSPSPRRRSVKDIIESINKNQRLLKVNQTEPTEELKAKEEILAITESTDSLTRNLSHLLEEEKKITNYLTELHEQQQQHQPSQQQQQHRKDTIEPVNENINARGSYYDNIPVTVIQMNTSELNNNMDVDDYKLRDKSKLDWNPVPKPRRSRHFSEEHKIDVTKTLQKDT